jgi:GNAT superfamily N-acetyltransferase
MNVRTARRSDRPAIRDVARRSLQTSYSLGPQAITSAIEQWYDEERLAATLEDPTHVLLVATVDEQVVAFSESEITADDVGTILWLHVDPDHRGTGIGTAVFDETRERLWSQGAIRLQGRVLADNADGNAFYGERGFDLAGTDSVEIDGRTYVENLYVEVELAGVEPIETEDGRTVYVDHDTTERGSSAPFHLVFEDADAQERWGYYCSNCDHLANAMDAMGRIECDNCGNVRKATRWDAAYL